MAGAGVQLWWSTDHERPWWPVMALESGLGGQSWRPAVVVHGSREALVACDGVGGPALVAFGRYLVILKIRGACV